MITDIHEDSLSFTTFIVFFIATEQPHNSQLISMENTTEVADLVLVGLPDDPEVQALRFLTFSLICLLTRVGNLGWPR